MTALYPHEKLRSNIRHHDPFDKMLLAQAGHEKMILITHDTKFRQYDDKHLMIV
ncbi:MAG: hypothetical protein Q4D24_07635 [Erysipelotrichaceae bacterium]|nr:hypothetical protein [Erysipelotrichaceae bacterium]